MSTLTAIEDRGLQALLGRPVMTSTQGGGDGATEGIGKVLAAGAIILGVLIVVPIGAAGYAIYKATKDPGPQPTPENKQAFMDAAARGDEKGMVVEAAKAAKTRTTLPTPLGFNVPNLGRHMIPNDIVSMTSVLPSTSGPASKRDITVRSVMHGGA